MPQSLQTISQSSFIRGLNASTGRVTQPKGSVPRITNMLFTRRGSLITCDGTAQVLAPSGITNTFYAMASLHIESQPQLLTGLGVVPGTSIGQIVISSLAGSAYASGPNILTFSRTNPTPSVGGSYGLVTITTNTAHNLTPGMVFNIGGNPSLNGSFIVYTVPSATSLTYLMVGGNVANGSAGAAAINGANLNPANTYYYKIAAADNPIQTVTLLSSGLIAGAGLVPGPEANVSPGGANTAVTLTINTLQFAAAGFLVYRGNSPGTEVLVSGFVPNTNPGGTVTFQDLGYSLGVSVSPPGSDTSQATSFFSMSTTSVLASTYGSANVIGKLPKIVLQAQFSELGAYNGNYGSVQAVGNEWTPYGGMQGQLSAIPSIVQFTDKQIIILGNGYPLLQFDGTTLTPITNSFVTTFPAWVTATSYAKGSIVIPTAPNGFYFTAIQAGTSGGSQPTWPTTIGNTINDGTVIWQNTGVTAASAPAGAAAGLVYAGSLWVGNTAPYNLSNGLDGPSSLRMSSSSNPNNWNPVNQVFIGKDDGSEITGLATFTIAESGIIPTGSLVVFKTFSTYQITGVFGASNFTIQQAQTDMGCVAPRTIQFVPGFGIIRLTHRGWAVFDGVRDKLLSEEVRPYVFLDPQAQYLNTASLALPNLDVDPIDWAYAYRCFAFQTTSPAMYVCSFPSLAIGAVNPSFMNDAMAFDIVLRAWTHIRWFANASFPQGSQIHCGLLYQGNDTLPVPLIADNAGVIHRWQAGDERWNNGGSPSLVNWSVRTPEVYSKNPSERLLLRRLLVRGSNTAAGVNFFGTPTVLPILDRVAQYPPVNALVRTQPSGGTSGTGIQLDIGMAPFQAVTSASVHLAGAGRVELDSFDWVVIPRPSGKPLVYS